MSNYRFSQEARDDIQEIWVWVAGDNPQAADELETDIYAACEMLTNDPGLGHRRPDLTDEQVVFWTVRKFYLVIYLPGTEPLEIVRILHGARDVSSELW